jgi:CMP-N-acetylneuraminic acid synthetase
MFDDLTAIIPITNNLNNSEQLINDQLIEIDILMLRKIRQLRAFLPKDKVVVCTESHAFSQQAKDGGATVILRDSKFTDRDAPISELIDFISKSVRTDHIAWTPCITPFFDTPELIKSFHSYYKNVHQSSKYDSLVSVIEEKKFFWTEDGPLNYSPSKKQLPSQMLPSLYSVSNGNYMVPAQIMRDHKYFLGKYPYLDVKPKYCGIDINQIKSFHQIDGYQAIVRSII